MRMFLKALVSWQSLAIQGALLVFVTWKWENHWVALGWAFIILAVLIWELLSKLFSPQKQTFSNNIRDAGEEHPVGFWVMNILWLLFAITLFGHFIVRWF